MNKKKMLENILFSLTIVTIIAGLVYALGAFVGGDFNPMHWHWTLRLLTAIALGVFFLAALDPSNKN